MRVLNSPNSFSVDALKLLLNQGADVNATDRIYAVLHSSLEVIEPLLDSGANVNAYNGGRMTVVLGAVVCDRYDVVDMLLRRQDLDVSLHGNLKHTVLMKAAQNRHLRVVQELLASHNILELIHFPNAYNDTAFDIAARLGSQ